MRLSHIRGWGVAVVLVLCAARAQGMLIAMESSQIADPQERARVTAALDTLQKSPADLPALEIALQTLPGVVDTIGITAIYKFDDPLKTRVCIAIQAPASVEVLAQALSKGSDLAATWACRRIANQAYNSDSPAVKQVGGVIDAAAQIKLKGPLLDQLKRPDGKVRAAAVLAVSPMFLQADRPAFLKPLLKDPDVQVQRNVLFQLFMMRCCDQDVEEVVAGFLQKDDPDLPVACCQWWNARGHSNTAITASQEAVFVKLGSNSHDTVRREVPNAMGEYATPEHPGLANMLLKMADSDHDDIARAHAIYALRNDRTPALHEKLLEWSGEGQPEPVRQEAQRVLTEYHW